LFNTVPAINIVGSGAGYLFSIWTDNSAGCSKPFRQFGRERISLLKVAITDLYRLKIIFNHFGVEEKHFRKFSAGPIIIYFLTKVNAGAVSEEWRNLIDCA
jgi:hypothetical protein